MDGDQRRDDDQLTEGASGTVACLKLLAGANAMLLGVFADEAIARAYGQEHYDDLTNCGGWLVIDFEYVRTTTERPPKLPRLPRRIEVRRPRRARRPSSSV